MLGPTKKQFRPRRLDSVRIVGKPEVIRAAGSRCLNCRYIPISLIDPERVSESSPLGAASLACN